MCDIVGTLLALAIGGLVAVFVFSLLFPVIYFIIESLQEEDE